ADRGGSMPRQGAAARAMFANAADRLREGVCGRGAMTAVEFEYLAVPSPHERLHHVGSFHCEIEAAKAYDDFLRQLCPPGARLMKSLNFPSLGEANFEEPLQDVRARALAGAATLVKEEQSFARLLTLFSVTPQAVTHEIIRVSGSSKVDALFSFKGLDRGLPLQVKAASMSGNFGRSYKFAHTRDYDGMLLLLIALDRDIMWATPGSTVATTSFSIQLDSERDKAYRVSDLGSALDQHFQDNATMSHVSLKHARLWCADRHQVEEHAHLQMADIFASVGFQLEKAHSVTEVDSMLVGKGCRWRIQEKSSSLHKAAGGRYLVHLRKGKFSRQAYSVSDFDLLLVYTACIDAGYVPTPELSWLERLLFDHRAPGHVILAGFKNKVIMSSAGGQRPPANRMTLQTFKARLGGASKGFKLLKKKRDALKAKFQALLKEIVDTKLAVGQSLKDGAFALAKAHYASSGDDIASTVIERAKKPTLTTKLYPDNVAGVSIPVFKMNYDSSQDSSAQTMGVGSGGAVLNATRETYVKAMECIVKLASLQTAFHTLDEEIKMTSRRVNALEYVLIPRIEELIHYITQEMDEEAREEFFRVKKVVEKKKVKMAREKELALKQGKEQVAAIDAPSILQTKKDDDLVF
ncbi:ATP6V1D, partial [Symbiodinium microadriaticum]